MRRRRLLQVLGILCIAMPLTAQDVTNANSELARFPSNQTPKYNGVDTFYTDNYGEDIRNLVTYEEGRVARIENFYDDGQLKDESLIGPGGTSYTFTSYYRSRKLAAEKKYKNGSGEFKSYYEDGQLQQQIYFNNGKGLATTYHPNGAKKKEENFVVMSLEYQPVNYNLKLRVKYAGATKVWCSNGNLTMQLDYNSGPKPFVSYYCSGKKLVEGFMIDLPQYKVGKWIEYYENGQMKVEYLFKNGLTLQEANFKYGSWYYYDPSGELVKEEVYKNNRLVETKEFSPNASSVTRLDAEE